MVDDPYSVNQTFIFYFMEMKHTGDYVLDEINMLEQECADLEEENKRLEEENKELKEKLSEITMVADDEKQSIEHILELEEENKKLKEELKKYKKLHKYSNWELLTYSGD